MSHLSLVVLQFSVAVEEVGLLDLREPLTVLEVDEAPSVKLTLCLSCLLVDLCHDALDQLQLHRTQHRCFEMHRRDNKRKRPTSRLHQKRF